VVVVGPPATTTPVGGNTAYVTGAATGAGAFRPEERYAKLHVITMGQSAHGRSLVLTTAEGDVGVSVIALSRPTSTFAVRFAATGAVRVTRRRQPMLLRTFAVEVAVTVEPATRVTFMIGGTSTPWSTGCASPTLVATRCVAWARADAPESAKAARMNVARHATAR
jgi:hypothetical protein